MSGEEVALVCLQSPEEEMLASLKAKIAEQVDIPPGYKLRLMLPTGQVLRGKALGPLLWAEVEKDKAGCDAEDEVQMVEVKSQVAAATASSTEPSEEPESEANEKAVEGVAGEAVAAKKKRKKRNTCKHEEMEAVLCDAGAKANAASEPKAKAVTACSPKLSKEPESGLETNVEVDVASRSATLKAVREKQTKKAGKTSSSNPQQAALAEKKARAANKQSKADK